MVLDLLVGSVISALAGVVMALLTVLLGAHRENRRWLERRVHRPLYGELTEVISGEMPKGENGYASLWADLEYYKTYRVDPDLAEALDRYASDVSELAGRERREDFTAFVRALPEDICAGDDSVTELPSGHTVDMRTWLRRNLLVLATHPSVRDEPFGVEPTELDYLWDEVDDVSPADIHGETFDVARALEVVSREFNWGYEPFYHHWDDGWEDDLAAALRAAAEQPESQVKETTTLRRRIGVAAHEIKGMITERADRGVLESVWIEWTGR